MLKVLHIASGDLWAGAEVQLYNLAVELNKRADIEVLVILLNPGELEDRLQQKQVNVQILNENSMGPFAITLALIKIIRNIHPDVVHTHRQKENVLGSIAAKLCGAGFCVRTAHGQTETKIRYWEIHKLTFRILDYLCGLWFQDRVIAVSEHLAHYLASKFPANHVVTIENGINIGDVIASSQELITAPLPGKSGSIKVCIVCRLTPVKRLDLFLQIAKQMLTTVPDNYDFYIFGNGPLEETIRDQIRIDALEDSIHMMGFQSNIPAYLKRMDILLITSDHEGLPMNLLEAMALNVCVIAHSIGGISEVLGFGKNGILVNNQDINEYVSAIISLAGDLNRQKEITNSAKYRINSDYNSFNCAEKHIALYSCNIAHWKSR